jgi:excisionase family DNA binding protein
MSTRTPCVPPDDGNVKPLAVTVKAACKLVGVGHTTMYGLIKAGRVNTLSIGRRRLVLYSSLVALVTLQDDGKV